VTIEPPSEAEYLPTPKQSPFERRNKRTQGQSTEQFRLNEHVLQESGTSGNLGDIINIALHSGPASPRNGKVDNPFSSPGATYERTVHLAGSVAANDTHTMPLIRSSVTRVQVN